MICQCVEGGGVEVTDTTQLSLAMDLRVSVADEDEVRTRTVQY